MKINPIENKVTIPIEDLARVQSLLVESIREIRKAYTLPMNKYHPNGPMTRSDHAQANIIEIGQLLGIDMQVGRTRGCDLDVRNQDES